MPKLKWQTKPKGQNPNFWHLGFDIDLAFGFWHLDFSTSAFYRRPF